MKEYKVKFISGSKKDEEFPIEIGQSLTIGRSNTNTVILTEHDVSKKHCILRYDRTSDGEGDIIMEVISSRITKLDGNNLSGGTVIRLQPGQEVSLGIAVVFTIQECDLAPESQKVMNDDETTNASNCELVDISHDHEETGISPDDEVTSLEDASIIDKTNVKPVGTTGKEETSNVDFLEYEDKTSVNKFRESSLYDNSSTHLVTGTDTFSMKTRAASLEEIENIKKTYSRKKKRKTIMMVLSVLLFCVSMGAMYFSKKSERESEITWPAKLSNSKAKTCYKMREKVGIVFPSTIINHDLEGNKIVVDSAFGKNRDIPFRIIVESWDDPASLEIDRNDDFKKYLEMKEEEEEKKEGKITYDSNKGMFFVNNWIKDSAGVPLSYVSYTRRLAKDDFFGDDEVFGYLVFFRYRNEKYIACYEVPGVRKEEASFYLRFQLADMFKISHSIIAGYWEGTSNYRKNTTLNDDLKEADKELSKTTPANWARIRLCLQSALVKAMKNKQTEKVEEAETKLKKFHQIQAEWYNAQKLAYLYALNHGKKDTMQQIQSDCESAFTSEFQYSDFRYELIRRKVWK
jgi:hypothetical protein